MMGLQAFRHAALRQTRRCAEAPIPQQGAGRYGSVSAMGVTLYDTSEIENDKVEGHKRRRPFNLGGTMRAMINRNRQRLGLPPVLNWKKFTSEAVRVREELCGLDDPRAQQQLERERKAKGGSSHQHNGNPNLRGSKPFSKFSQTSSVQRTAQASHPIKRLMADSRFRDCIAVSRMINESSRESVASMQKALGKAAINPSKIKYQPRAPVVSVMGHVDHGKTTLLDYLRQADRAGGEAGGITQSVGAFQVKVPGSEVPVTFIDTPGHAAFSSMRRAGVNTTDIVVLILSAPDGVQPQTVEVIKMVQEADLPMVVAINKIDRVHDRDLAMIHISNQLREFDVNLEMDGGDVLHSMISAKSGEGVGGLLDNLLLQTEMLELTTPTPCRAEASVLETESSPSVQDPGMTPTFSSSHSVNVIVRRGVLTPGMTLIANDSLVKVTALLDEMGQPLKQALPSQPCSVMGFNRNLPHPNTLLVDAGRRIEQKEWRNFWSELQDAKLGNNDWIDGASREERFLFWTPRSDIPDQALPPSQRRDQTETLRLILKGNTQGMVDAMEQAVDQMQRLERVTPLVIYKGVGDVDGTDGHLYSQRPGETQIVGCGVSDATLEEFEHEPILVDVIFHMVDMIKQRMVDFYPTKKIDKISGHAICNDTFSFSKEKQGNVGGLTVKEGQLNKQKWTKVMRGGPLAPGRREGANHRVWR
eukprot:TRINITY_DN2912_c0_g1_i3.p1 TRINITY_DN2912_c0_g1~~TRINITY_DN2912_c0_g1_i3.p1  ORF type:complete len:701 (+),score=197.20 TRINITY_DN2912_c0_g1_i3:137-2239(+)